METGLTSPTHECVAAVIWKVMKVKRRALQREVEKVGFMIMLASDKRKALRDF